MEKIQVNKDLQLKYSNQYANEDSNWRETGAKFKALNIIEISKGYKFKKVLEVGAGEGSILNFLDKLKFSEELYALEISESGIKKIKEKNINLLKEVVLFDGYNIPYPDKSFDLVILSHVLEHVEFERTLLREIKRVSKHQIIEVPKDYRKGVDKKTEHFLSYGHINVYSPSSIRFLLKSEGFEIVRESLKVYDKKVFEFMAKGSFVKKLKFLGAFYFKKVMMMMPGKLNENYCNSITFLLK